MITFLNIFSNIILIMILNIIVHKKEWKKIGARRWAEKNCPMCFDSNEKPCAISSKTMTSNNNTSEIGSSSNEALVISIVDSIVHSILLEFVAICIRRSYNEIVIGLRLQM